MTEPAEFNPYGCDCKWEGTGLDAKVVRPCPGHIDWKWAAVLAEREACAKIADDRAAICRDAQKLPPETLPQVEIHTALEAEHIASLIRKRT